MFKNVGVLCREKSLPVVDYLVANLQKDWNSPSITGGLQHTVNIECANYYGYGQEDCGEFIRDKDTLLLFLDKGYVGGIERGHKGIHQQLRAIRDSNKLVIPLDLTQDRGLVRETLSNAIRLLEDNQYIKDLREVGTLTLSNYHSDIARGLWYLIANKFEGYNLQDLKDYEHIYKRRDIFGRNNLDKIKENILTERLRVCNERDKEYFEDKVVRNKVSYYQNTFDIIHNRLLSELDKAFEDTLFGMKPWINATDYKIAGFDGDGNVTNYFYTGKLAGGGPYGIGALENISTHEVHRALWARFGDGQGVIYKRGESKVIYWGNFKNLMPDGIGEHYTDDETGGSTSRGNFSKGELVAGVVFRYCPSQDEIVVERVGEDEKVARRAEELANDSQGSRSCTDSYTYLYPIDNLI